MVFVGVVVGALMTARRARLLDRMSLFWRAFVQLCNCECSPVRIRTVLQV